MNRSLKTVLILLFIPVLSQAQSIDQKQRWGISFSPAIVSFPSMQYGFQPGIEYQVNERIFILTEIAFTPFSNNKDSSAMQKRFFRIKPELRYLLREGRSNFRKYFALQLSYSFRNFKDLDGGIYYTDRHTDTVVMAFDQAKINSPVFTASFQFGGNFTIGNDLLLDLFTGIGFRNINTKHSETINPRSQINHRTPDKIILTPEQAYLYEGGLYRCHFNLGVRLLYRFRKD